MNYDKSWENFINCSKHLKKMQDFVDEIGDICPLKENVFRFFLCDLDKTKYIVLGMDPYPSTCIINNVVVPVATGRSFEVLNVEKWTDKYKQISLSNIFKSLCYYKYNKKFSMDELRSKDDLQSMKYINIHKWFDDMEKDGVIFLNASLTTKIGKSGAHIKIWHGFMNELILFINTNINCKWMIWGEKALDRVDGLVDNSNIIYSCHPASRINNDFIENNCFKKAKDIIWF